MFSLLANIQSVQGENQQPTIRMNSRHILEKAPGYSRDEQYVARPILCNVIFQCRTHSIL